MNEITNNIFNVPAKLEPVETATILGKEFVIYGTIQDPWFKAKDVAEWIEYDTSSINKLINSVDEDEKGRKIVPTLKGNQEVWFLSENGVYEVLMQSRKPIAKEFKKEVKMLELENKPKNAEEAIKAGWKTAKEMYTTCETSRQTWENFVADIRKSISQKPNFSCESTFATEKCITGPHNTKYYHPKVEKAFLLWLERNQSNIGRSSQVVKQAVSNSVENNEYKYTKEEICGICNVGHATFERFASSVLRERDFISVGSNHKKLYTETVLQQFQLWLKKNAMNAGGQRTEGSIIKQDNQKDLFIGCIATKGTPAEIRSLADHLMEMANQKELLEQTKQQNQKLQLENQTMKSTLQYDKVKGWYRWGDLKRQWKPHCDKLKKGNYETIFYEAGLEYGKDYEEIVFNGCEFPTCMVSPTAVPKLISYLHIL